MRRIERGPMPPEVRKFAMGHTRDWINYYCGMRGGAPRRFWVPYIEELGSRSNYNCWYCERRCKIAIKDDCKEEILVKGDWSANTDHFRPRSLFPHLSLSWSNWVFSCETCNHFKDDRWPNKNVFPCEPDQNNEQIELEYVNPCASDPEESPAKYFNFYGGRIEPRQGISKANERKACNTINAFDLDNLTLVILRYRSAFSFAREFYARFSALDADEQENFSGKFLGNSTECRVEFLIRRYANEEGVLQFPGMKALIAEEILRHGIEGLERLGLPENVIAG